MQSATSRVGHGKAEILQARPMFDISEGGQVRGMHLESSRGEAGGVIRWAIV